MCRKTLGLCHSRGAAQTELVAENKRRTSTCGDEVASAAAGMKKLVADTRDTVTLARSLTEGEFKDPHHLRVAVDSFL